MLDISYGAVERFTDWGWCLSDAANTHGRYSCWRRAVKAYAERRRQCI